MTDPSTPNRWQNRYEQGDTPWDRPDPDRLLVETLDALQPPSGRALDIGCGTGTNAIYLASRGFAVTAVDIAPKAIDMARDKVPPQAAVDFKVGDILSELPVDESTIDFAFDRGCFHSVGDDQQPVFAEQVARCVAAGGWWLSLCGNRDDPSDEGPPKLTAAQITAAVEPWFEIHALRRSRFSGPDAPANAGYLNWKVLMRRR